MDRRRGLGLSSGTSVPGEGQRERGYPIVPRRYLCTSVGKALFFLNGVGVVNGEYGFRRPLYTEKISRLREGAYINEAMPGRFIEYLNVHGPCLTRVNVVMAPRSKLKFIRAGVAHKGWDGQRSSPLSR